MRLLIDECFPAILAVKLDALGAEVAWATDLCPSASDHDLIDLANSTDRIVLTADVGFGTHIFRDLKRTLGIVVLRGYQARTRFEPEMDRLASTIIELGDRLIGNVTIISPGRIRQRELD
ncbi:MAG: DUF5615 family PIN-like protein [Hyphomicrobiaceae bacterium]|nr:DUF5615 family PIN-like protein [Hyphomicrobiaceae bacterium]